MKRFIQDNKAIFSMIVIIIVCAIVSVVLLLKYFYYGNGGTKYGDRLEGIENFNVDERFSEIADKIKEDEKVIDATVNREGKTIKIRIVFVDGFDLLKAQNIAKSTLDQFSDEEKAFFDIAYTLKSNATEKHEGINMMGSHNAHGTNLVWNNNNTSKDEEEE